MAATHADAAAHATFARDRGLTRVAIFHSSTEELMTMNSKSWFVLACAALSCVAAQADTGIERRARVNGDGSGHGIAQRAGGFTAPNGAQGGRTQRFVRGDDGSVNASSQTGVTGNNGSAATGRNVTRSADGSSASAERNTTATNANTGVTYDGSTSWTKGSGLSRSGSCKDSAGNTVTCGSQR